ncbi:hypothetical protein EOD08_10135 [Mesorhizobium sp. M6A.T.Ca.TU.002.02.2.1]|nr:hypothetical protein EOD08_10135 [Mesorhizobium sp. M6A.T.Ca.TU.002.02.2.1]
MPAKMTLRIRGGLWAVLMSLTVVTSDSAFGAESSVTAAASIPCDSLNHETLGAMEGPLNRGEVFGIPKDAWGDDVAYAFKKRLQACDEANLASEGFSLSAHFDAIWDTLGPRLKEEHAAAARELEYAQQARQRQIEQEAQDKKAADQAAERDRRQAEAAREEVALAQQQAAHEREAEIEAARQAEIKRINEVARDKQAIKEQADALRRIEATEQAERDAYEEKIKKAAATRLKNPSCVKADALRKDIDAGDVANLLSAILIAHEAGDTSSACKLADGFYRHLDDLRAASTDCDAAEAAQIGGTRQSLYAMRKEMNCLGWFE